MPEFNFLNTEIEGLNAAMSVSIEKFSFKDESCKNEKPSMGMKNRNKNLKNLLEKENEKITKTNCGDRKHAGSRNILKTTQMFSVTRKILTERRSIHSICRRFKAKIPRA